MTGSAALDFIIGVVLLVAVVALFFVTVDKVVKDALLIKIGKIVIGVIALIAVIAATYAVLFGGGGGRLPNISGTALVHFAVGLLVVILVCFILERLIVFFGFMVVELQYVLQIVALMAILLLAGATLFGGGMSSSLRLFNTPSIMSR